MMQWFDSREIKERVINSNDLYTHYDIDSENKLAYYYMLEEFDENISVTETKYESAEINVLDTDPEKAKKIVLSMITNFDDVIRTAHKKRALEDLTSQKQHKGTLYH